MPRVCPKCHYESPMDTAFCPACGAPMDETAARQRAVNTQANAAVLPMRWHRFLIFVVLPLSLILTVYNLITAYGGIDLNSLPESSRQWIKTLLGITAGAQAVQLFLAVFTEVNLVRMQWRGVRTLMGLYALQAVYSLISAYMLRRAGAVIPMDLPLSAAESAAMILITRLYYRKRRALFAPPLTDETGGNNEI